MRKIGFRGYMVIAVGILILTVGGLYFFNMNRVSPTATKKQAVSKLHRVRQDNIRQ